MFQNCKILATGVSSNAYHEGKGERGSKSYRMSPSALKLFAANPQKWVRGYNPPDSEAKAWGNLLDTRLLTPKRFDECYAVIPETYETHVMECPQCGSQTDSQKCAKCGVKRVQKKIQKAWHTGAGECQDWLVANMGRVPVKKDDVAEVDRAIERILGDEILKSWHDACQTQVHVAGEWLDKATGIVIPVECLIDYVPKNDSEFSSSLGDLKSTKSGGHRAFRRWCYTAGYHTQAAFDLDIFNAATGDMRDTWCFILSENYPPYETGRRILPQSFREIGQKSYRHALGRYAKCLATWKWPGYDDGPETWGGWSPVEPEPWMDFEALEDSLEWEQQTATEEATEQEEHPEIIP